jgi:hypothetical protein
MAEFDCPTGECDNSEPPCESVKPGDEIDPNSREHTERNACNRCPSSPPTPVYRQQSAAQRARHGKRLSHYTDSEGNIWSADNSITAAIFHGDPISNIFTAADNNTRTFRVTSRADGGWPGWQCRYVDGAVDDTTGDMGTYDYGPAPSSAHTSMDVSTHRANGNYVPGLTEQY